VNNHEQDLIGECDEYANIVEDPNSNTCNKLSSEKTGELNNNVIT